MAIGQVIAREVRLSSSDHRVLAALGFDRRQLVASTLSWLAFPVVAGSGLAVLGAVAASPLMPIGPARTAEPHPGFSVDFVVLGVGLASLILLFGGVSAATAWFVSRDRPVERYGALPNGGSRWAGAEAFGRAGFSPSAEVGLDMAFTPGQGASAVPVRSALLGAIVAVAAVVSAITFGANLERLVSTPYLYGVTWDSGLDAQFSDRDARSGDGGRKPHSRRYRGGGRDLRRRRYDQRAGRACGGDRQPEGILCSPRW